MAEGKVTTDAEHARHLSSVEIYNTIIENHNMTQLKINEILGMVKQLAKDNVKKASAYEKSKESQMQSYWLHSHRVPCRC